MLLARRTLFAVVCVATSACSDCGGRLTEDDGGGDAGTDAAQAVCTNGAFTTIAALAELNTPADERGLRFTPDELYGVFSRTPLTDAQTKPLDIFATTRTSRFDPLGAQHLAENVPVQYFTVEQLYPSITSDFWLRFESLCPYQTLLGEDTLCVYVPPDDAGTNDHGFFVDFDIPDFGCGPFGAASRSIGDGYVTSDGGSYYFTALTDTDGGIWLGGCPDGGPSASGQALFVANSFGVDTIPPGFSGPAVRITATSTLVDNPALTEDELSAYVSVTSAQDSTPHIALMTRASLDTQFESAAPLHELDSPEGEYPTWISPDRCRLYFSRRVGGQWDLFVASRQPQ